MNSIGDLIDKLVIENIKIHTIRERINMEDLEDEEKVKLNDIMITLNDNRGIISNELDDKVDRVISKKEKNAILKKIKTYEI